MSSYSHSVLRFVSESLFCMDKQGHCLEGDALHGLAHIVDDLTARDAASYHEAEGNLQKTMDLLMRSGGAHGRK